jgi:hypothetical protein
LEWFHIRYCAFSIVIRIAPRLDLAGIAVIDDFIRVDHSAIFIGMNDADLHIAGGVRTSTVTLDAPRNNPDLLPLRHVRHRYFESLCYRSDTDSADDKHSGKG